MKLFLASEGKDPRSIKKLKTFVGGKLSDKKIVYIPTAGNGEVYGAWRLSESLQVIKSLTNKFEVVELESCAYQDIIGKLENADILWFGGGMSGYLLYWMHRLEFPRKLPKILKNGVIYVGSSAGSMVCAKTQFSSEWYIGEPEAGASLLPGLGLIDFEIYPHYEEKLYSKIDKLWKKGEIYLLKDGEAITVENGKVSVKGKRRVISK